MQFYALEDRSVPVSAAKAIKQKDYQCPECSGILRLRGGVHKQLHFYHLKGNPHCFQHRKSLSHLQAQRKILSILPEGQASMEKAFPSIQRIADVVWEEEKLVFEVQCSPITSSEVQERNRDYAELGYQVIWILHCRRFNQKKMSAAELHLCGSPRYFTDIDEKGEGKIYDQFEIVRSPVRRYRGIPLTVDLSVPHPMTSSLKERVRIPESLLSRFETWPVYFLGDLVDSSIKRGNLYTEKLLLIEERYASTSAASIASWMKIFFYWAFSFLLKKTFTNAK